MTVDEVLSAAALTLPDTATEVRAAGDPSDGMVFLQFQVPDLEAASTFAKTAGCEASPIERLLDDPFRRSRPGAPEWWQSGPHEGALSCRTEGSARSIRLDPLDNGSVRVQVAAVR